MDFLGDIYITWRHILSLSASATSFSSVDINCISAINATEAKKNVINVLELGSFKGNLFSPNKKPESRQHFPIRNGNFRFAVN